MLRTHVLLLLLVALAGASADAATPRRVCRDACQSAIAACQQSGERPRRCRRRLLRECRRNGVDACATVTTTTTSMPAPFETTTTTMAGSEVVNDCDPAQATDLRGQADVTVLFGQGSDLFDYAPECITVTAGTAVTFEGDFSFHPLQGGEVVNESERPDAASPFGRVNSGSSRTFVLDQPGVYPYYCDFHSSLRMWGAVIVVAP